MLMMIVVGSVVLLSGFSLASSTLAALPAGELSLNLDGAAVEIHADAGGNLWVSDWLAGEVWQVNSAGDGYTVYATGAGSTDARPDNQGGVWWVNETRLTRLNTTDIITQTWDITGSIYLVGLGFDSRGLVWMTDGGVSNVYSFDPSTRDLCTYPLPASAEVDYPEVSGTQLWLGDTFNGRLLRLDFSVPASPQWSWWQLPAGSYPYDVTLDASGNPWYTDSGLGQLGYLAPGSDELTVYPLPRGASPRMLAASGGKVWYTEQSLASLGVLDPAQASATPQAATTGSSSATYTCSKLQLPVNGSTTTRSGVPSWADVSYQELYRADGWVIYQLPVNSQPTGIALTGSGYMVDSLRQVLAKFSLNTDIQVFLPLVLK